MKKSSFIILVFIFFLHQNIEAQNKIGFIIEQVILPDGIISKYEYFNSKIKVQNDSKTVFKTKISKNISLKIDSIIKSNNIEKMDSIYSNDILDGLYWNFTFKGYTQNEKNILFDNYFHPVFNEIVELINKELPEKYKYISFSYGFFPNKTN